MTNQQPQSIQSQHKYSKRDFIADILPDSLVLDGFDEAIIGTVQRCGMEPVVLYDTEKCIEIMINDGMTYEDALEYFDYNILGSYVGEYTPMFADIIKDI